MVGRLPAWDWWRSQHGRYLAGMLLCLSLDLAGLAYIWQQLDMVEQAMQQRQQLLGQVQQAMHMQPTALHVQQQYQHWQALGVLKPLAPAQWDQRMQTLQQLYQLPHLRYQQTVLNANATSDWSAKLAHPLLTTQITSQEISLSAHSEQHLLWWLQAIQLHYPAGWYPHSCHWQRVVDASAINGQCQLRWVSFAEAA